MTAANAKIRRVFLMKQFRQWHWISGAICLIGLLLFALTGVTLNHANLIEAEPIKITAATALPADMLERLPYQDAEADAPLPPEVLAYLGDKLRADGKRVAISGRSEAEWTADEIYLSMPRPGGDAFLVIDRASGEVSYERTTRGAVSFLNDLHKGRNTGLVWRGFLDVFAVGCVVFTLSGLGLLWLHSETRKITWPLTMAGLIVPLILVIIFIH